MLDTEELSCRSHLKIFLSVGQRDEQLDVILLQDAVSHAIDLGDAVRQVLADPLTRKVEQLLRTHVECAEELLGLFRRDQGGDVMQHESVLLFILSVRLAIGGNTFNSSLTQVCLLSHSIDHLPTNSIR